MEALAALEGEERKRAEDMLLQYLPDTSDDSQHMLYRVMSDKADRREGGRQDILAAIAGRQIVAS